MPRENFSEWSKQDLIDEVKKLKKRKKYGIVWEDKLEQVALLCKEKLPVLTEDKDKEIETDKEKLVNILIEGDNYHALSVLNYTHKGQVDVIYIDPPYNTGSDGFRYNDKIVDANDTYRHSKWLSFMNKRLKLSKKLLKREGVIFISIDDNEDSQLKILCDEIFGPNNFIAKLIWKKKAGGSNDAKYFAIDHEYILCYTKNESSLKRFWIDLSNKQKLQYKLKDKYYKERGPYLLKNLYQSSLEEDRPNLMYEIVCPDNSKLYKKEDGTKYRWRWEKKKVLAGIKNGRIEFKKIKGKWQVFTKQYLYEEGKERKTKPRSILMNVGMTRDGGSELKNIFRKKVFDYPKPISLIDFLISIILEKNGVVLDFFAGTGTTGHAVLKLNKENNTNHKFILCTNNENNICTEVCYPRIKKVIQDLEREAKGKLIGNKPGGLKYFKTDFVNAEPTDRNKKKLVDKSTEMLCLKEDCFDEVKKGHEFKIFKNQQNKYLGIIYDDKGIDEFKKEAKKLKKKFVVYVFSLDESAREEEFEDVAEWVELKPIPAVILNVYRRIFK